MPGEKKKRKTKKNNEKIVKFINKNNEKKLTSSLNPKDEAIL